MIRRSPSMWRTTRRRFADAAIAFLLSGCVVAQGGPYERSFHQSKAACDEALQELKVSMSGRLPTLDGFATDHEHPLDRYQRGYFQSSAEVVATRSGGCTVKVTTKVTAWYSDSAASRSGYRLLTSNGRIENDLLDQLSERLIGLRAMAENSADKLPRAKESDEPTISAPMPNTAPKDAVFASARHIGVSDPKAVEVKPGATKDNDPESLRAQAASLEEALKNQAHPNNIVAVKKSGTPVVATPSLSAKPLFTASMHDEFELLDFNRDWVHVRISSLSRGWIWRDSLEMPDNIPDNPQAAMGPPPAANLFQVSREETGTFPGDWEPLRGRNVKIVSVQKLQESSKEAGPQAKLEFAKFLLDKNYAELARNAKSLSGLVLIFDSADGGMIAATLASIEQWKAGKLSDAALWHQCFFDPPETFAVPGAAGSP